MTDNEIIKALECCKDCSANLNVEIIDFINRQQAENEELRIENQSLRAAANSYKMHYNKAKSEAIKEFAERVKMEVNFILLYYKLDKIAPALDYEVSAIIQKIEKEMTEEDEDNA